MNHTFPQVVDASFLAAFRACPQRAFRTYIEHWKPKGESIHLVAGKAFASGLEAARRAFFEEGFSDQDALGRGIHALMKEYGDFQPDEGAKKTLERMCGALEYYFEQYPLDTDSARPLEMPSGKSAIEFNFIEPLPYLHPVSGDPILYTGRSDMICSFAEGIYIEGAQYLTIQGNSISNIGYDGIHALALYDVLITENAGIYDGQATAIGVHPTHDRKTVGKAVSSLRLVR